MGMGKLPGSLMFPALAVMSSPARGLQLAVVLPVRIVPAQLSLNAQHLRNNDSVDPSFPEAQAQAGHCGAGTGGVLHTYHNFTSAREKLTVGPARSMGHLGTSVLPNANEVRRRQG